MNCPSCGSEDVHKSFPLGLPEGQFVIKCDSCNHGSNFVRNQQMRVKHVATIRRGDDVKEILEPTMRDIADKHGIELDLDGNPIEDFGDDYE